MSLLTTIQDVTDQIGLPRPTSVVGTADTQVRQLLALANQEGRELARRGYWNKLTKETTFTTTATETQSSVIPDDFDRLIEGSVWNRTQGRKVAGPIDPQRWQALKTNLYNSVWDSFRIRGGDFLCQPVPVAGETWAFEYVSLYWLTDASGDNERSAWTADDDVGLLCECLMAMGIVWRFLKAKGMDYSEAYRTYEMELQQRLSNDGGMRIIDLGSDQGGSAVFDPFTPEGELDHMSNQPDTRTVGMVHFPFKDETDPRALDVYLDDIRYAVTPAMYGGTKDDATIDNIAAIEAAFAASNVVFFDGVYHVGDGGVEIDAAGTFVALSPTCGVRAIDSLTETTGNGLINITASGVNVKNLLIDGRDAFRRGVKDEAGGTLIEGCDIKNLYNNGASAVGIFANATAGGSIYRHNRISEVESVDDSTLGNDAGAARGVQIFTAAAVTKPYVIHDNDISRIIGEEGDGVQVLCFASSTFYSSGKTVVSENRIERCSRRGIKIQAHECTVRDNNVVLLVDTGTYLFAGIDVIDSEDIIVDSNRVHVTSTMRGISVTATVAAAAKRVSVTNNRIKTDVSTSARAILVNDFEDCNVDGNYVEYGYINVTDGTKGNVSNNVGNDLLSSGTVSFILSDGDASQLAITNNVVLSGAIYAAVHIQGADNIAIGNKRVDGDYRCVYLSTSGATDNVIANNVSFSTTYDAAIFSTVTVGDQTFVKDNVSLNLAQAGPISAAYTAAEIADISDAVNTSNKIEGLIVYDTTNDRLMVSSGSAAGSAWFRADGGAFVSPA